MIGRRAGAGWLALAGIVSAGWLAIAAKQREKFFGEPVAVSTRDRLAAMVELRDSGPGRPVQT